MSSVARPFRMLVTGLLAAAVLLGGCGLSVDDGPVDIDRDIVELPSAQDGTPVLATGAGRIFLIAPTAPGVAVRLRAVARDVGLPDQVVAALVAGPSEAEFADQYRSAVPSNLTVNGVRRFGAVVTVDVGQEIRETTGDPLVIALAQFVHSLTSLEGVDGVRLTVDGNTVEWPDGTGGSTSEPLTVHDFPGLIPSTQPAYPAIPSPAPE